MGGTMGKIALTLLFSAECANILNSIASDTCPDEDLGTRCQSICETEYLECSVACSDADCLLECGRIFSNCSLDCPCAEHCPNGCNGCLNPICVCGGNSSPQNENNLTSCKQQESIQLGDCVINCKNDQLCRQQCLEFFDTSYADCPCQDNCPFGCPCDSYACEPDEKSVLVLNTRSSSNQPVLIGFNGGEITELEFTMGANTDVYHSCSATLNGEMFLFGGYDSFTKQISKINGCSLELIGQLPFDFERGGCGTFLFPEPRIMLCFGRMYKGKCTSYNGKDYFDHPDAINQHYYTSIGNLGNKILAVGGYNTNSVNSEAEVFDITTNTWTARTSFLYCSSDRAEYGVVSRNDK